jgi:hypothetical protein
MPSIKISIQAVQATLEGRLFPQYIDKFEYGYSNGAPKAPLVQVLLYLELKVIEFARWDDGCSLRHRVN